MTQRGRRLHEPCAVEATGDEGRTADVLHQFPGRAPTEHRARDLLSNTWNAVVLWALRHGPRRPGDLRAHIGGISPKILTETLRRLEYNGLVSRTAQERADRASGEPA